MIKKSLLVGIAALSIVSFSTQTIAAKGVHTVENGESLWDIGKEKSVSVLQLKKVNDLKSNEIHPGQTLAIPENEVTNEDRELLAKLVHAEAKGEPYAGKVAVATVVLNRVDSTEFPGSIKEVIYQVANGHYAFSPVQNGEINQAPSQESRDAVQEALAFRGQGQGSLFFYNPVTSTSDWITNRETMLTIGKHRFAK
ncbi:cell wall hydrolase [Rossellomorea aquimaris]|jgi:N-acetylmuramoyl-L-alanine amidase|uniref:LysM peptidoglycan-binding domain-containing protein n=1 Tax=Rossellomorea aquimaris TaxID=189382 RepID=A0A5D4UFD6_9BACI|nr:cell wall hydrolase [Rossellomorea aquimaris]TYS80312.1 LysM peptidoglycan-binding domain-containing protein [Rossellomorea aquimaris]TYS85698.1 LysM peptidoglycan-binding domain-containing protein [Rossellomorea aquimaris]